MQPSRALNGVTELIALQDIKIVEAGALLAADQILWQERDQINAQKKINALREERADYEGEGYF